ncbi:MAG: CDP-alcohol phosphatidyltransferase family protein [Leptospira sp.]|nr:CDP-alcohol phosphatidyltransferase family protein [Leptospira sp.]
MQLEPKKPSELFKDKIFTISNFLSILRVLLLPFFFFCTYSYAKNPKEVDSFLMSIYLCLVAVLTDYLDGLFARILKQETNLGRYLDPVCDKLVTLGGLLVVTIHFAFPKWILIVYFIRELLGVWLGGFLYLKRGLLGRPNIWGKVGVGLVAISVLWYMATPYYALKGYPYEFLKYPEISAYVLMFVLSIGMIAYAIRYWNIILKPESIELDPDNKKQAKKYRKV